MTVTKIALGVGCGIMLAVAGLFVTCAVVTSPDFIEGISPAMEGIAEQLGEGDPWSPFSGRTRSPTGHEAKVTQSALGESRLSRCGSYAVELDAKNFDTLLVECASGTEYLVRMRGTPSVIDYRLPE